MALCTASGTANAGTPTTRGQPPTGLQLSSTTTTLSTAITSTESVTDCPVSPQPTATPGQQHFHQRRCHELGPRRVCRQGRIPPPLLPRRWHCSPWHPEQWLAARVPDRQGQDVEGRWATPPDLARHSAGGYFTSGGLRPR